jgi:hypothetical protein
VPERVAARSGTRAFAAGGVTQLLAAAATAVVLIVALDAPVVPVVAGAGAAWAILRWRSRVRPRA